MESYKELKLTTTPSDNLTQLCGKSVLHFSDGTLELDGGSDELNDKATIDPQQLAWAPWVWYYTSFAGSKALQVCDYFGESLATFFGITTPKYQFQIDEYMRLKKEEEQSMTNNFSLNGCSNASEANYQPNGSKTSELQVKHSVDIELQSISTSECGVKY